MLLCELREEFESNVQEGMKYKLQSNPICEFCLYCIFALTGTVFPLTMWSSKYIG